MVAKKIFVDNGIADKKVVARGVGGDFPYQNNSTSKGRFLNRRLTMEVTK